MTPRRLPLDTNADAELERRRSIGTLLTRLAHSRDVLEDLGRTLDRARLAFANFQRPSA